jgi:hypothetical protein
MRKRLKEEGELYDPQQLIEPIEGEENFLEDHDDQVDGQPDLDADALRNLELLQQLGMLGPVKKKAKTPKKKKVGKKLNEFSQLSIIYRSL